MEKSIKLKLFELENQFKVKILFACESGSRAWGFPSPDSDYDVRFIYIHDREWYLSIDDLRDVIEPSIENELDIRGWELRKSLRLLRKSNASILDWLQSPVVYRRDNEFHASILDLATKFFSPKDTFNHYLSMALKYISECQGNEVKLKKYFYALRTSLACLWILKKESIPPVDFQQLMTLIEDKTLSDKILELTKLKAVNDESYFHPKQSDIESFVRETIHFCEDGKMKLIKNQGDTELLNNFFRSLLNKPLK